RWAGRRPGRAQPAAPRRRAGGDRAGRSKQRPYTGRAAFGRGRARDPPLRHLCWERRRPARFSEAGGSGRAGEAVGAPTAPASPGWWPLSAAPPVEPREEALVVQRLDELVVVELLGRRVGPAGVGGRRLFWQAGERATRGLRRCGRLTWCSGRRDRRAPARPRGARRRLLAVELPQEALGLDLLQRRQVDELRGLQSAGARVCLGQVVDDRLEALRRRVAVSLRDGAVVGDRLVE